MSQEQSSHRVRGWSLANKIAALVVAGGCLALADSCMHIKLLGLSTPARDVGGWCLNWDLDERRIDGLIQKHGREAILAATAEIFEGSNEDLYGCAAQVLGRMGGDEAVRQLIRAAGEGRAVTSVVMALDSLGDPRSGKVLLGVLHSPAPHRRLLAAQALGGPCGSGIREDLAGLLPGPEPASFSVAIALGLAGDRRGADKLLSALASSEKEIREGAALALGKIKDHRALEPLLAALRDADRHVRAAAAQSLGELGDPKAREALRKALVEEDYAVRENAKAALEKLP